MSTNFLSSAFSDWFSAFGTGATIFGVGFTIGGAVALRNRNALLQSAKQETEVAVGKAEAAESKADAAQQKFDDLKTVLDGEVDLWLRKTPEDMNQILRNISQSIPIITICNFKGGVGKTTLSANLAAYFQQSRRVLLIDFDYQGSLTDKLLASASLPNLEASAIRLIRGTDSAETVISRKVSLHPSLSNTHLFPCFYGFHKEENKILTRWLTDEKRHEIRFNLHRYLHSREFQSAFDLVIIDAPPRLTTATINAICAAHTF